MSVFYPLNQINRRLQDESPDCLTKENHCFFVNSKTIYTTIHSSQNNDNSELVNIHKD